MNTEDKLYKSLEAIAIGYSKGNLPVDRLIAACDKYKEKTNFDDDYGYQVLVSKSLMDSLNGVEQDAEIAKSILPGQTKVFDGVLYVWSQTKPGSKEPYDWHVVKKTQQGQTIGRGSSLTQNELDVRTTAMNDLFPHDLDSVTKVKDLGGSTGAKLVKDTKGREFVLKTGVNDRAGHVKVEYFANQIYDLLGFKAKKCELYDVGQNTKVLLSTYEHGLRMPQTSDFKNMSKGFMLDVLLANWDIYQNDNCLVDGAGNIVRIDNGGVFDYKAQGKIDPKKFTEDVVQTFKGMVRYNSNIYQYIDENELKRQIDDIKAQKDVILAYLKLSGLDDYAKIMEKRIDSLDSIYTEINKGKALTKIQIQPRKLMPEAQMYREIDDAELTQTRDEWCADNGVNYKNSLEYKDRSKHGWELLNKICELRGFTGRPQVVTEDEYWKLANNGGGNHQFFRGVGSSIGARITAEDMVKNTMFEERCFYGTIGVYGEGIYAAQAGKGVNKTNYKSGWAFGEASGYAKMNGGINAVVMKGMLDPKAKVIKYDDLFKEAQNYQFDDGGKNAQLISMLTSELKKLQGDILDLDDEIRSFSTKIEKEVQKEFNYDPVDYATIEMELNDINWDAVDISGDPDIPSYDDVVVKMILPYMKKIGADVYHSKDLYRFTIPGVTETLTISKYQYDNAVRRKNIVSPSYNNTVERFKDYVNHNLIKRVDDEVKRRQEESGDALQKLIDDKAKLVKEYNDKEYNVNDLKNKGNRPKESDSFMAQITGSNANYSELLGLYAASQGYDAIMVDSAKYMVILNRTKVIMSNEIDYI